jgi:hypothetical protein
MTQLFQRLSFFGRFSVTDQTNVQAVGDDVLAHERKFGEDSTDACLSLTFNYWSIIVLSISGIRNFPRQQLFVVLSHISFPWFSLFLHCSCAALN